MSAKRSKKRRENKGSDVGRTASEATRYENGASGGEKVSRKEAARILRSTNRVFISVITHDDADRGAISAAIDALEGDSFRLNERGCLTAEMSFRQLSLLLASQADFSRGFYDQAEDASAGDESLQLELREPTSELRQSRLFRRVYGAARAYFLSDSRLNDDANKFVQAIAKISARMDLVRELKEAFEAHNKAVSPTMSVVAKRMGISRPQVYLLLKEVGLSADDFRDGQRSLDSLLQDSKVLASEWKYVQETFHLKQNDSSEL